MDKVEEILKHHGVKGMKWGVRRFQPYPKGKSGTFLGNIKQRFRSRTREGKALVGKLKTDSKSTKTIEQEAKRLQKENDMKRLSNTKKEKQDYRNRENMSEQEINRKVRRLKAKDFFNTQADTAGKELIAAGKRVTQSAAALGMTYASKKGSIDMGDLYDAVFTPKHAITKNAATAFADSPIMKKAMGSVLKQSDVIKGEDTIQHHGVKGMKKGVRRYQPYSDGTFTRKEKTP